MAELLLPLVLDGEAPMEVAATAALALGLVYQGTANGDAVEAILQVLYGVDVWGWCATWEWDGCTRAPPIDAVEAILQARRL